MYQNYIRPYSNSSYLERRVDPYITPTINSFENYDLIDDDLNSNYLNEFDPYDYEKLLQTYIFLTGFLFFPLWFIGIFYVHHNSTSVSRMALINLLMFLIGISICFYLLFITRANPEYMIQLSMDNFLF